MPKSNITISAVWLRQTNNNAEVLVEIDNKWYLIIQEHNPDGPPFSHIKEARGIEICQEDELTKGVI